MIDHVFKTQMDRFWDAVGRALARTGLTPNMATMLSFCGVLAWCALFRWHGQWLVFAAGIGAFELLDNVDGAIARVTDTRTRAGAFLDATTDRIKEVVMFVVAGEASGTTAMAALAMGLGLCVSYNLARGQAEGATFRGVRAPLFERLERIVLLCVGCVGVSFEYKLGDWSMMGIVMCVLIVGNAVTAAQRLWAGFQELKAMS